MDRYFAKDRNHVYNSYNEGHIVDLEIDPNSFENIDNNTIKDATHVYQGYYRGYLGSDYELIPEADPATFEYVGKYQQFYEDSLSYYKDKNHIFAQGKSLLNIDATGTLYRS